MIKESPDSTKAQDYGEMVADVLASSLLELENLDRAARGEFKEMRKRHEQLFSDQAVKYEMLMRDQALSFERRLLDQEEMTKNQLQLEATRFEAPSMKLEARATVVCSY